MSFFGLFKCVGSKFATPSLYDKRHTAHGFTLIEIILSILIIGISMPAIMTAFLGITASKNPEFVTQASFLAQKYMEKVADKKCPGTSCDMCSLIPSTDGPDEDGDGNKDYTLTCSPPVDVTALDPDTIGTAGFGKKLTLTIGRTDGEMTPVDFFALF